VNASLNFVFVILCCQAILWWLDWPKE